MLTSNSVTVPSPPPTNISQSASIPGHSFSSEAGDLAIIPPNHPARTLVLCFDGTSDSSNGPESNVWQFFHLLKTNVNCAEQMSHYEVGIGTSINRSAACGSSCTMKFNDALDKALGWTLDTEVMRGYSFLMQQYIVGDRISLFGFSWGAYIVRALAEMIYKVGLLSSDNVTRIGSAYTLYLRDVDDDWKKRLEELSPRRVDIDFIGVWDTICPGDIIYWPLPFSRSNTSIRVFRHALALHERRACFKPMFYEFDAQDDQDRTDVQEVWFPGCHCDIGGCAVPYDTPHSLGRISLRWMVRECFRANTGIQFDAEALRAIGLDPGTLYPIVMERPNALQPHADHFKTVAPPLPEGSEEEYDVRDALSPIHDRLASVTSSWLWEFIPMWHRVLGPPPGWAEWKTIRINLGRRRVTPKDPSLDHFSDHPSVQTRQQAKTLRSRSVFSIRRRRERLD
ncbi:hypothetical protein LXA43DRAFT_1182107 [Ganoderma leucocontextum]|nr:hypothetical protein LXA43DRAFT_1182107 [Ganoderma leucocontextum]